VDVATTYQCAGEPKMACAAAVEALDECDRTGYGYELGARRVIILREGFPSAWEPLRCVRELDERLRLR
jgi:hypothetical protein